MGSIKRWLCIGLALAIGAWGFLFAIQNDTAVAVDLVWWQLPALRVSWWLLAAFALGLVLGLLMGILPAWYWRYRARRRSRASSTDTPVA